jgi:hypothetical protein
VSTNQTPAINEKRIRIFGEKRIQATTTINESEATRNNRQLYSNQRKRKGKREAKEISYQQQVTYNSRPTARSHCSLAQLGSSVTERHLLPNNAYTPPETRKHFLLRRQPITQQQHHH